MSEREQVFICSVEPWEFGVDSVSSKDEDLGHDVDKTGILLAWMTSCLPLLQGRLRWQPSTSGLLPCLPVSSASHPPLPSFLTYVFPEKLMGEKTQPRP